MRRRRWDCGIYIFYFASAYYYIKIIIRAASAIETRYIFSGFRKKKVWVWVRETELNSC